MPHRAGEHRVPWLLGNKSSLNQSTWACNNACAADPLNSTGSKLLLPGCRTRAGAKSRLLPEVPSLTRSDGAWPGLGRIALASMQPSATQGLTASGPDAAWAGLCRVLLVAAAGLCLLAHPIFGECCNFAPGQHCPGQLLVSPVLGKKDLPSKGQPGWGGGVRCGGRRCAPAGRDPRQASNSSLLAFHPSELRERRMRYLCQKPPLSRGAGVICQAGRGRGHWWDARPQSLFL